MKTTVERFDLENRDKTYRDLFITVDSLYGMVDRLKSGEVTLDECRSYAYLHTRLLGDDLRYIPGRVTFDQVFDFILSFIGTFILRTLADPIISHDRASYWAESHRQEDIVKKLHYQKQKVEDIKGFSVYMPK